MLQDVRFAVRMMRSHPWFTAAIVATLALGIGVNTTIFTLVNAVLYKALPFRDGDRIVAMRATNLNSQSSGNDNLIGISYPNYQDFKQRLQTFDRLEAHQGGGGALSENGLPPERRQLARVTPGYFEMLGVQPEMGRGFSSEDWAGSATPVALISHELWTTRFGSDRTVVGRTVRLDNQPTVIIGIMAPKFGFPNRGELWVPLRETPELLKRDNRSLTLTGVRRSGVSIQDANADANRVAKALAEAYPESNKDSGARVLTYHDLQNGGEIRIVFLLMLGAVGFVLLIACANVANMMLSRALSRSREISVRAAMGASRGRLIRLLMIESTMLAVAGGILGLAIARYGVAWFDQAVANVGKPSWIVFEADYLVFLYFAGLCLASGLLFGIAPALRASRVDLNESLKDGSRGSDGAQRGLLNSALVVFQFTLAVVLLVGAGLFIRGALAQKAMADSLPLDRVIMGSVDLPEARYPDAPARLRFFEEVLERAKGVAGVQTAALVSSPPLSGAQEVRFLVEGEADRPEPERHPGSRLIVSPEYRALIDLPLLAGRDLDARDGLGGNDSVLITAAFADHYWPGQSPLGKRFTEYRGTQISPRTVVGVVGNLIQERDQSEQAPLYLLPYKPGASGFMFLMARTGSNPKSLTRPMQGIVQQIDSEVGIYSIQTLAERMESQTWYLRVFGTLFSAFAAIALVMASVGIYAVIAQATGRRTREIGVRMAMGATSGSIVGLILSRGIKQLAVGLVLGLAAAFGVARLMSSILFQVSATDPVVFIAVPALLATVGLVACWLPARKAAKLHPTEALRQG